MFKNALTAYSNDAPQLGRRMALRAAAGFALGVSLESLAASKVFAAEVVAPWGDPATLVSAIGAGTLSVVSVAQTIEAYGKGFGYVQHWRGKLPKVAAELWGVPSMAGRQAAVVGPPGFNRGMIRVLELGKDFRDDSLKDTLGWFALEIHVKSPDEVVHQLKGLPFVHTGGPGQANAPDGQPLYRAAQFLGPSGESLYMTQHMQLDKLTSAGRNNVGPLFIQTLNAYPYEATRDFYHKTLGMVMRMEVKTRRDGGTRMSAVRATEYCSVQLDEFGPNSKRRAAADGCFAPGVNMSTFTTRNLAAVTKALEASNQKFVRLPANPCPPFAGAHGIYLMGNAGERLEIFEVTGPI